MNTLTKHIAQEKHRMGGMGTQVPWYDHTAVPWFGYPGTRVSMFFRALSERSLLPVLGLEVVPIFKNNVLNDSKTFQKFVLSVTTGTRSHPTQGHQSEYDLFIAPSNELLEAASCGRSLCRSGGVCWGGGGRLGPVV